jgi:hypothetical protein
MAEPLVLYSTSTWLAFSIAERFYSSVHYAWCSPYFSPPSALSGSAAPPTSIPREIYENLFDEVIQSDSHSSAVDRNRVGILRGAACKRTANVITAEVETEIAEIVRMAEVRLFRPLLFVIPFAGVRTIAKVVPPKERAHPMSIEYRIDELPRHLFDVLELRR